MAMKRLIICCDGTWNEHFGDDSPTNVAKTVRAICPEDPAGISQVVYYGPGVGTGNVLDRLIGGGFGYGLSRNVQDAYLFLVSNYQEGDELYFFGFSRGAYTVRSLAGLVGLVGVLGKRDLRQFPKAYAYYRTPPDLRDKDEDSRLPPEIRAPKEADIHFLGAWDTVGALGIPFSVARWITQRRRAFHDVALGRKVRNAYHALAIDERRRSFEPALWNKVPSGDQRVEQTWFAGVHSNIGGGYDNSGLSDVAWRWMLEKAAGCGLDIDWDFVDQITRANPPATLHNSRTWKWRLRRPLERQILVTHPETERIHASVIEWMDSRAGGAIDPSPYRPAPIDRLRQRLTAEGKTLEEFVVR